MLRRYLTWFGIALFLFPVQGNAAYLFKLLSTQEYLEKEVDYRIVTGTEADFETAASETAEWVSQAIHPFPESRDPTRVWAKFDLPAVTVPRQVYLMSGPFDRVEYFIVRDGQLEDRQLAGILVPRSQRTGPISMVSTTVGSGFAAAQLVPDERTTVYVFLATDRHYWSPRHVAFIVADADKVRNGESLDRLIQGIFSGAIAVLVLGNLFLFALNRGEWGYFHLAGSLALSGCVSTMIFGLTSVYLWPEHPEWDYYCLWLGQPLTIWFFARFIRHYLETPKSLPRWDSFLKWGGRATFIWMGTVVLLRMLDYPMSPTIGLGLISMLSLGAAMLFFGVAVAAVVDRLPQRWLFFYGMVSLAAGVVISFAGLLDWLPATNLVLHAGQTGTVLLGILMSLGQAFRLRVLQSELVNKQIAEARLQGTHEREKREFIEAQSRELENRIRERTAELAAAKEKSDSLLANILPRAVIDELHETGESVPRRHEEASILFTDFVGFTQAVTTMPAQRLVQELDEIFRAFDDIVRRNGLEKIKTIGDAYMAAAGLPVESPDHAVRCVRTALELASFVQQRNENAAMKWHLRIGVHSGAVVAGIVGRDKFAYDVWGDTVNVASRLEGAGQAGRVNISAYTYELIRGQFECEYRGRVMAKSKGEMDMYFVVGERPAT